MSKSKNYLQSTLDGGVAYVPSTNDLYTPKWVFETLGLNFDLDVASPPGGVPWIPAAKYYTQEDDGLEQEWHGRVWCNPPYSNATPWARKWHKHGNGILLVPTSRAKWFIELWEDSNVGIVLMPWLTKFVTPDGKGATISFQTAIFAIGCENKEAAQKIGLMR